MGRSFSVSNSISGTSRRFWDQLIFAGWQRLGSSPDIEVLNAALHLFIDSHTPGLAMESKLVLAQAALEGLAEGWPFPPWANAPAIPAPPPGREPAWHKLCKIAVSLGIPLAVPASLQNLAALPDPTPAASALEKMTWIRNSVAHLGNIPRLARHSGRLRYEARQLAAWHLELALLRMLDATGVYLNRLTATHQWTTEPLPWTPPAQPAGSSGSTAS